MPRPRVFRREGIILRELDYAEADRILTILTPAGKVSALAKGVRRVTSHKAGHLGLFSRVSLMLAQGRNLDIVTQAEGIEEFEGLRKDLERFSYASYVAEVVDRVAPEDEDVSSLYDLLMVALRWFSEEEDLVLGARLFELRLLEYAGYQAELFECVSCQTRLEAEENYFANEMGGLLCPRCGAGRQGVRAVSVNAQKVLRYLARHEPEIIRGLRVSPATHAELEALLMGYLEYTLERDLNSAHLIRRLKQELSAGRG